MVKTDIAHSGKIPDLITVDIDLGMRVMIISDLLLSPDPSKSPPWLIDEMTKVINNDKGVNLLVINGNLFDLLTEQKNRGFANSSGNSSQKPLDLHHPFLCDTLKNFASKPDQRIVWLLGVRDMQLAYDTPSQQLLNELNIELGFTLDIKVHTGIDTKLVKVDPGWRFDPASTFSEPPLPNDTPLIYHLLVEILPAFNKAKQGWLNGIDKLKDQSAIARFITSRFVYRKIVRYWWLIILPFVAALFLKIPFGRLFVANITKHPGAHFVSLTSKLIFWGITTVILLGLVIFVLAWILHKSWSVVSNLLDEGGGALANDNARSQAHQYIEEGYTGFITAHTRQPELSNFGNGFYANTGACSEVVVESQAYLGLPSVFISHKLLSWIEAEIGADLHLRLIEGHIDATPARASLTEHLLSKTRYTASKRPLPVAVFPGKDSWPPVVDLTKKRRLVRRLASAAIAIAGLVDLLTALTPPIKGHLHLLETILPLGISQTAGALVGIAGICLLILARGIRRGQAQAWFISVLLLGFTVILHLVRGIDIEDTMVTLVVLWLLLNYRGYFTSKTNWLSVKWASMILIGGVLGIVILTTIALETTLKVTHHHFMSFTEAAEAVIGRLVGIQTETVPQHINVFLAPTLLALGIGLAVGVALLFTRPVINRTTTDRLKHNSSLLDPLGKKVRELVSHWGNNSLDYFILRNDKQYFFHSDCLISYRVISAICLVSPDPIGPDDMRERTWSLFRQFVDKQGLPVAVMAASEEWLPIYRNSGMHDFYLGDEAIIEVNNFNLEGGKMKGLRQAYNRIANYGYYATFHNPTPANQEIREELKVIMEKGRKGEGERGFSMSLNRLFDTQDPDLLLTVVHNKDGFPVGFCQFVPFMGNKGYSLDLMRRDNGQHPNGLIDFLIISTIKYLANSQVEILSLNFTVMRSLLSGEMGEGLLKKTEQRFYQWLSSSKELQIESLWRFSAKYHPIWKPRYIVIDSPEHLLPITIAIVQAEAIRELPLVGRLVSPVSID